MRVLSVDEEHVVVFYQFKAIRELSLAHLFRVLKSRIGLILLGGSLNLPSIVELIRWELSQFWDHSVLRI